MTEEPRGSISIDRLCDLKTKVVDRTIEEAAKVVGACEVCVHAEDNYGKPYALELDPKTTLETFTTDFNKLNSGLSDPHIVIKYEFRLFLDSRLASNPEPDGILMAKPVRSTILCTYDELDGGGEAGQLSGIVSHYFAKAFSSE